VCSHSSRTGSSCISMLGEYPFGRALNIGRTLYDPPSQPPHLLLIASPARVQKPFGLASVEKVESGWQLIAKHRF
jgi:hypothetical protein